MTISTRSTRAPVATAMSIIFFTSCVFAENSSQDLDPVIKANRLIESVKFVPSHKPNTYDVLVEVPTRSFTREEVDLSVTIHLLINRSPIKGGSALLKMGSPGTQTGRIDSMSSTSSCQASYNPFNPFDFLAATKCTCGFGCNSVGVCERPEDGGACKCNQPSSVGRLRNIPIASGDEVVVLILPAKDALTEVIRGDDMRTIIFREEMASR